MDLAAGDLQCRALTFDVKDSASRPTLYCDHACVSDTLLKTKMPRKTQSGVVALPEQSLIVDNGAFNIKAGFATVSIDLDQDCHVIPNCMARGRDKRVWVGAQLENCKDFGEMAFRRPVEKGYLVNWEAEKEIWDNTFFDKGAKLKVLDTNENV